MEGWMVDDADGRVSSPETSPTPGEVAYRKLIGLPPTMSVLLIVDPVKGDSIIVGDEWDLDRFKVPSTADGALRQDVGDFLLWFDAGVYSEPGSLDFSQLL